MVRRAAPPLHRFLLGKELRRVRDEAGRKASDVARSLGWSESKLSRIETGDIKIDNSNLSALLDTYGMGKQDRQPIQELWEQSRRRDWLEPYVKVLPSPYESYIRLEAVASEIFNYSSMIIPGLLQTVEYAKSVIQVLLAGEREDTIDQRVKVRMARQTVLTNDPPPRLRIILDEAVLRRPIGGPEVMRRQMLRLLEVSSRSTITIRVLPLSVGAHRGIDGPFSILRFAEGYYSPIVYCETMSGGVFADKADELGSYWMSFEAISRVALSPEESADMISRIADDSQ